MKEKCKIYQGEEFKDLVKEILEEDSPSIGINAVTLTLMLPDKYLTPLFKEKRQKTVKDIPNAMVSARINENSLRLAIYKAGEEIPYIFEYQGPLAKELYDKLLD